MGGWPNTIQIDQDGKILIGGNFISYNNQAIKHLVRINENGGLDPEFSPDDGFESVHKIELQEQNYYLVVGGRPWSTLVRLFKGGSLDTQFGSKGNVTDFGQQSDGKIVAVGTFGNRIERFDKDGVLDNSFSTGSGPDGNINRVLVLENDQILISGSFQNFNGVRVNGFARLNPDGSLDEDFVNGLSNGGSISAMALQSDGRIVLVGAFNLYSGVPRERIVRINPDGSLDESFQVGAGIMSFTTNTSVSDVKIDNSGRILIGGNFESYAGNNIRHFARILPDGSFDQSLNIGTGPNASLRAIAIQDDGKILLGGNFRSFDGISRNKVARILGQDLKNEGPIPDKSSLDAVEADCLIEFDDLQIPTATDYKGENIQGSVQNESQFPIVDFGTFIISWEYQDDLGNVTLQEQEILVKDDTPPVPILETLEDLFSEGPVQELEAPLALDNCDGEILGQLDIGFPIFSSTVLQWKYIDRANNIATQEQVLIIQDELCLEVDCGPGLVCFEGTCFPTCTENDTCDPDHICYDGRCIPDPCSGVNCGPNEVCYLGICFPSCTEDDTCDPDHICYDGRCIPDPCLGVDCPPGQQCFQGTCFSCTEDEQCGPNHICRNGRCIADPCLEVDCPPGMLCDLGTCFSCTDDDQFGPNHLCVDGKCIEKCDENGECPPGFECWSGRCMPDPCFGVTCGESYICHGGACFLNCSEGQTCDPDDVCYDGRCIPDECNDDGSWCPDPCFGVTCGESYTCHGGIAVSLRA